MFGECSMYAFYQCSFTTDQSLYLELLLENRKSKTCILDFQLVTLHMFERLQKSQKESISRMIINLIDIQTQGNLFLFPPVKVILKTTKTTKNSKQKRRLLQMSTIIFKLIGNIHQKVKKKLQFKVHF